jgi:hypothetical protein
MDCWKEGAIEWAAIRIVDGERSPDIDALLAHARECARCSELLGLFEGVERGIRRDLPAAHIHPLVRLRTQSSNPSDWCESPTLAEFDVAAETARPASISEMTLSTEDGGFIVRIFRKGDEIGARAVLVSATDAPARMSLMIGGVAYAFDDSGIVEIPEFPASEIQLVTF